MSSIERDRERLLERETERFGDFESPPLSERARRTRLVTGALPLRAAGERAVKLSGLVFDIDIRHSFNKLKIHRLWTQNTYSVIEMHWPIESDDHVGFHCVQHFVLTIKNVSVKI